MTDLVGQLGRTLSADLAAGRPLAVALSGGRDSSVLLHALCGLRERRSDLALRALHVEHDLQPDAAIWAAHCAEFCHRLGVPFRHLRVSVPRTGGTGVEAAARDARYAALRAVLDPGELLLTAHHREDQLETLLLHLRRGSGVDGMVGIPQRADFPPGQLLRPLLDCGPEEIARHAAAAGLRWVEDSSNRDQRLDRNFLRQSVLPQLRSRWPDFARGAARSAARLAESAAVLDELAAADARACADQGRIDLAAFVRLGAARRRLLIRHQCRQLGLPVPPENALTDGLATLLGAAADRNPVLRWPGAELRRYRQRLYLLCPPGAIGAPPAALLHPGEVLELGGVRGRLALEPVTGHGLALGLAARGLGLRFRRGGERLRLPGQAHHRPLKLLFQERGLVPWMRAHVPLLFAGDRLVAVADLWLAAEACAEPGEAACMPRWEEHAPLQ